MLWVANGGRCRSSSTNTCSSVICTSSCTARRWITHCYSFCCQPAHACGLCKPQKCDKIFSFPLPARLSVRLSILPKGGPAVLSTAAASSNSNPKDLQCSCLSSAGPQLHASTLDFSSQACSSILLWTMEGNSHLPKENLRDLYILTSYFLFSSSDSHRISCLSSLLVLGLFVLSVLWLLCRLEGPLAKVYINKILNDTAVSRWA